MTTAVSERTEAEEQAPARPAVRPDTAEAPAPTTQPPGRPGPIGSADLGQGAAAEGRIAELQSTAGNAAIAQLMAQRAEPAESGSTGPAATDTHRPPPTPRSA